MTNEQNNGTDKKVIEFARKIVWLYKGDLGAVIYYDQPFPNNLEKLIETSKCIAIRNVRNPKYIDKTSIKARQLYFAAYTYRDKEIFLPTIWETIQNIPYDDLKDITAIQVKHRKDMHCTNGNHHVGEVLTYTGKVKLLSGQYVQSETAIELG